MPNLFRSCNIDNNCGTIECKIDQEGMFCNKKQMPANMDVKTVEIFKDLPYQYITMSKLDNSNPHIIQNSQIIIPIKKCIY